MKWYGMAAALAVTLVPAAPLSAQRGLPADLDAYMARAMATFGVPGASVAVVKDGQVVLARGYGVRRLGDPAPVDAHTLFQIASNTKAMTATALAILVDEGKLRWDDPVTRFLPWFELYDPWVTRQFTVRDMLTHRSGLGLGAGDLLWFHSSYTPEEVVRGLRAAKPVTSFRSAYAYDNVLYIGAGLVVGAASGEPWDRFVRDRIFRPLGMTETVPLWRDVPPGADIATPYGREHGRTTEVPRDTADNTISAGAVVSNAADMARWMMAELDSGRTGSGRLWSQARTREMWAGVTVLPIGGGGGPLAALRPNFALYGLGVQLRDYRGHKLVTHTGGLAGMISRVLLVPDLKLGITVLTNAEAPLMDVAAWHILDSYLDAPATDWIAAWKAAADAAAARTAGEVARAAAVRDSASRPSLPLAGYAGEYTDSLYGGATLAMENGHLVLRLNHSPAFVGDLEHWQHDVFVAHWRQKNLADAYVYFALRPDGTVDTMRMLPFSPDADFSFDYQDFTFRPDRRAAGP